MKILAIDTATKYLSLAITDNDKILGSYHGREEMKHSALLVPTIDRLLKNCNLKLKDINAIALSIGPGSFTGLRIGVATCKAFNLALGIPIVAVPTLDVIAYNFIDEKEGMLCPIIDAKKEKIYACFYKKPYPHLRGVGTVKRISAYMLTDINSLIEKIKKPTLVFGDGIEIYGAQCKKNPFVHISAKDWHPRAEIVARLGFEKAKKRRFENPDKLVPMYLHSQYCQVKGHS